MNIYFCFYTYFLHRSYFSPELLTLLCLIYKKSRCNWHSNILKLFIWHNVNKISYFKQWQKNDASNIYTYKLLYMLFTIARYFTIKKKMLYLDRDVCQSLPANVIFLRVPPHVSTLSCFQEDQTFYIDIGTHLSSVPGKRKRLS